jgi:hypothetical protein
MLYDATWLLANHPLRKSLKRNAISKLDLYQLAVFADQSLLALVLGTVP